MSRSNAGRSTTGRAQVPYFPTSELTEATRYLRLVASRVLSGREQHSKLDDAIRIYQAAKGCK